MTYSRLSSRFAGAVLVLLTMMAQPLLALPPGNWKLDWSDEFDGPAGAPPSDKWMLGATDWGTVPNHWRDATISRDEAFLDGDGHLVLRARYADGQRLCPYLVTRDPNHPEHSYSVGPGDNGVYIECRANVSRFKAWASWFAFWLMADHPYTGDARNGTEIDVMEYVPFFCDRYTLMDKFNTAVHAGKGHDVQPPFNKATHTDEYGQTMFNQSAWNTWGLEWYKDRQVYYLNGKVFWENKQFVSTDTTHSLRLTVEIQNKDPNDKAGHQVGRFEDNPPNRLPSEALVDYVRVYMKQP